MFADLHFFYTVPVIVIAFVYLIPDYFDYRLRLIESKIKLKNAENENIRLQQSAIDNGSGD